MRMSIRPRWSHEGTPRSEILTSVIQLLLPFRIWRYPKLKAKPLVGPRVIWVLIPRMRFIPREGDTQLFKQAPGRMDDVEAVQAGKKGLLRLDETPQPAEAHQRAKLSWHCHQLKGVFCQICHALFAIATSQVSGGF